MRDEGAGEDPEALARRIRGCTLCRDAPLGRPLPIPPNPILSLSGTARLLVAGQAPGNLADRSSKPFNDPSGMRLRDWMGIGPEIFYDPSRVAILPMGFCFPGPDGKGGDRPPRRECAMTWHDRVMAALPQVDLVLAIGLHAQRYHLGADARPSLTATVEDWRALVDRPGRRPAVLPLPHPSWRNNAWIKRHPFFEAELLPALKLWVATLI
ncbi:uracil-DNA glycosylase family protein [Aurantimonas sp. Leaf443]|uniref:uracil-DNA glycosylase family protein n=1 Tax=Aurantimonas sp. Leaf443 TaxID=1736378 RepID=UPI0006F3FCA2|nr:uracil-DNA glycosylase family protein [Aurantimonas sp. Leaf443]KQT86181.1 uracil-DNA glycosylase [Aurantimonas sp. Leaf443]